MGKTKRSGSKGGSGKAPAGNAAADRRLALVLFVAFVGMVGAYFLGRQQGVRSTGITVERRVVEAGSAGLDGAGDAGDGGAAGPGTGAADSEGGIAAGGAAGLRAGAGGLAGGVDGAGTGTASGLGGDPLTALGGGVAGDVRSLLQNAALHLKDGWGNMGKMLRSMNLVYALDEGQVKEAAALLEDWPAGPGKQMLEMAVIGRWAEFDPAEAAAFAQEHVTGQQRYGVFSSVATAWAARDPDAALGWFEDLRNDPSDSGPAPNFMLDGMFQAMGARDMGKALGRLAGLETSEDRVTAVRGLASGSVGDPERMGLLLEHLAGLEDSQRAATQSAALGSWSRFQPEAAAAWVDANTDPGERDGQVSAVLEGWMEADPERAADWAMEQSGDAAARGRAAQNVVQRWTWRNANAAAAWLGEQDGGVELDGARQTLVRSVAGKDPESAFIWASTIESPAMRESASRDVFFQWHRQAPAEAEGFLLESDVPQEKAIEWLEKVTGQGGGSPQKTD